MAQSKRLSLERHCGLQLLNGSTRMGWTVSQDLRKRAGSALAVALSILFLTGGLSGCASAPRYRAQDTGAPKRTMYRKPTRGKVYQVGMASYYDDDFHGKPTASGEIFDMYAMTAAHKELELGTLIRVTHLGNQKTVIVRVNDRGPFVGGRILDLSYGAARKLDMIGAGTAEVKIEILPKPK